MIFHLQIRRALGDFGVPISILILCVVDILIGDDVFTQKLSVPEKFSVTSPDLRGWIINPMGLDKKLPIGHIFSAAIPALLGVILIFMETLITGQVNRVVIKSRVDRLGLLATSTT